MKKIFLGFVFICTCLLCQAQANVTSTAISVQGIARNSNSNAVSNSSLSITAELYYINSSNAAVNILTRTGTINTDAFGVFAYVVDIASSDFVKITNSEAWIKISSGGVTFAQEKLMAVPYALHAQNGAPTGSIMPYVGSTAPAGWILCDGRAIPSGDEYTALRSILGNNVTTVPDLRGMFLRGTGTNGVSGYTTYAGPSLLARQAEMTGPHSHTQQGTFNTSSDLHDHDYYTWTGGSISRVGNEWRGAVKASPEMPATGTDDFSLRTSAVATSHTVTISGATQNNSGTETRPVNFGVNYIIKI